MPYFKRDDGCSLYYEDLGMGHGKPVAVFLNGTMQTTLYWKALAGRLRTHFGVLLYDARAQGASELGPAPLSLDLHVSDLIALLDHLSVERAHLVGVSHGAYVAYATAARSPQRVRRLVMISVSARSGFRARLIVRSWLEILKSGDLAAAVWATIPHVFGEAFLRQNEKLLNRIAKSVVRRNNAPALLAHLEAIRTYTPLARSLKRLEIPMVVLSGTEDPLVPLEGARHIADACGGRHVVFNGVGHSIPAEAPERFQQTITAFLLGEDGVAFFENG